MPAESSGYKRATALELARLLVRFDHVASIIVSADRGIIAFEIESAED